MATEPAAGPTDDVAVRVETDQQLHALGSLVRHRIIRVLRDQPATVTQIADRLGIAKGSSNYHVKVLAKAGLIQVVDNRKVRGVTELYYGLVGTIGLPDSGPGQRNILMRNALAEVEAAPEGAGGYMRLQYLRLSKENFDLAVEKIIALHAELAALHDPEQPAADLFTAFYRPHDTRSRDTAPESSRTAENPTPATETH
ncbi:ArsR/SmtB family transcription factor [Allokutzneria albata]|uniref:Helix-turn-helix domain-containing protein n=1 Tax=Allokutzneria albata TaxID=211114 RepID=A0A1G9WDF7_ALLAB|nr:winged helix-turn-helix domain-containing protein [Allokutzneria albata]SDM82572.1 Helix-turn-helix domain-containing protein [Allokutzneria albata]